MNRHRARAVRRQCHRRPNGRQPPSALLRRGLCRARSFFALHERLGLVELLALHDRRLHELAREGCQMSLRRDDPRSSRYGGRPGY